MTKAKNILDAYDYLDLTLQDRNLLDDWLKSIGGAPNRTKSLNIDRETKKIIATEYLLDKTGGNNYSHHTILGEIENIYHFEKEPPVWKD